MEQNLKERIEKAKKLFPYDETNVQNIIYYSALPELLHDLRLTDKDKDDPIVRTITALKQELNRYQGIYGRL